MARLLEHGIDIGALAGCSTQGLKFLAGKGKEQTQGQRSCKGCSPAVKIKAPKGWLGAVSPQAIVTPSDAVNIIISENPKVQGNEGETVFRDWASI